MHVRTGPGMEDGAVVNEDNNNIDEESIISRPYQQYLTVPYFRIEKSMPRS